MPISASASAPSLPREGSRLSVARERQILWFQQGSESSIEVAGAGRRGSYGPDPASYDPKLPSQAPPRGGRMDPRPTPTMWEKLQSDASGRPAPGHYDATVDPLYPRVKGGGWSRGHEAGLHDRTIERARELPGPTDTVPEEPPMKAGGKFSESNPKSYLDWTEYFGKQVPGPADYDTLLVYTKEVGGGRFAETEKQPLFHWEVKRGREMPGPGGTSELPRMPEPKGGRMAKTKSMTYVERVMLEAGKKPGPSDYSRMVDYGGPGLPGRGGHGDMEASFLRKNKSASAVGSDSTSGGRGGGKGNLKIPGGRFNVSKSKSSRATMRRL